LLAMLHPTHLGSPGSSRSRKRSRRFSYLLHPWSRLRLTALPTSMWVASWLLQELPRPGRGSPFHCLPIRRNAILVRCPAGERHPTQAPTSRVRSRSNAPFGNPGWRLQEAPTPRACGSELAREALESRRPSSSGSSRSRKRSRRFSYLLHPWSRLRLTALPTSMWVASWLLQQLHLLRPRRGIHFIALRSVIPRWRQDRCNVGEAGARLLLSPSRKTVKPFVSSGLEPQGNP